MSSSRSGSNDRVVRATKGRTQLESRRSEDAGPHQDERGENHQPPSSQLVNRCVILGGEHRNAVFPEAVMGNERIPPKDDWVELSAANDDQRIVCKGFEPHPVGAHLGG
jgi:hypothetical protein